MDVAHGEKFFFARVPWQAIGSTNETHRMLKNWSLQPYLIHWLDKLHESHF